jgi:hypothetical protein
MTSTAGYAPENALKRLAAAGREATFLPREAGSGAKRVPARSGFRREAGSGS